MPKITYICPITGKHNTIPDTPGWQSSEVDPEVTPELDVPQAEGWGTLVLVERGKRDLRSLAAAQVAASKEAGSLPKDADDEEMIQAILTSPESYGLPPADFVTHHELSGISPAGMRQIRKAIDALLPAELRHETAN